MANYARSGEFDAPAYGSRRVRSTPRNGLEPNSPRSPTRLAPPRLRPPRPQTLSPTAAIPLAHQQRQGPWQGNGKVAASYRSPLGAPMGGYAQGAGLYNAASPVTSTDISDESREKVGTPFFEKKVSIFRAWQLFVMWMAITGLTVYIGSYVGFRHILKSHAEGANATSRTTETPSPRRGFLGGHCDEHNPCKPPAICVQNACVCQYGSRVVGHVCDSSDETTSSNEGDDISDSLPPTLNNIRRDSTKASQSQESPN